MNDRDVQDFAQHMVKRPWMDVQRVVVHVNWDPAADIKWQRVMGGGIR